jgi:hypothetical protein
MNAALYSSMTPLVGLFDDLSPGARDIILPLVFAVWIYLIVLATRATSALWAIARGVAQLNQTNQRIQDALDALRNKP